MKHDQTNPCQPTPCGPNSQCKQINEQAVCSCLPSYKGTPPTCRPECVLSTECPSTKACVNQKCVDPCTNVCGTNTECKVHNHSPLCLCRNGYTGDAFTHCYPTPSFAPTVQEESNINPCSPSPCGPYSECREINGLPSCSCLTNYIGMPPNCRLECTISAECSVANACIRGKCIDPCPGSCGFSALCKVINHTPTCLCPQGYTGDPFVSCQLTPPLKEPEKDDPCNPSPCGPNAICNNGACNCMTGYHGDPYFECRPECVLNTECPRNKNCRNNKCVDPCPGTCAINAICDVINHIPMCRCPDGMTGSAFIQCNPSPKPVITNPCHPSPCGPNSQCREINQQPICSCLPGYLGTPPLCRPECISNSECPPKLSCLNQKCRDPCEGSCGVNAKCTVVNHSPFCSCPAGMSGDPFNRCDRIIQPIQDIIPRDPCQPTPCGPNSNCKPVGEGPSCSCLTNYIGSPPNCRPECVTSSECGNELACVNQKCEDPCPNLCGSNAVCRVISHIPTCVCPVGYTGDPFMQCSIVIEQVISDITPCHPNPCGANAVCRELNNVGSCQCLPEYTGNPYEGCRPECIINSDCSANKACVQNKCNDPCPGTCGQNAECQVVNHIPSCTCKTGYTGNPYIHCGASTTRK